MRECAPSTRSANRSSAAADRRPCATRDRRSPAVASTVGNAADYTSTDLVALSVPLDRSHAGNGCLQTIPGSHKGGARSHWDDGVYKLNCNASVTEEDVASAVLNELAPGDIVAHHGLAVHGSSENRSDELRTTYIIQYAAADAFAYTTPVIDSRHRNLMVRGEPATHARVEAGVIELLPDFSAGYSSIFSLQTPVDS